MQAELKTKSDEIEALQSALSSSRAEADEAKADSTKALSPLEDALKQVHALKPISPLLKIAI